MYYSYIKIHRFQLFLLTALISVFFFSCRDSSITDSDNVTVNTSELMGTWNPIDDEGNVNYYESFSLQNDQGVHEVKNESNRIIYYRLFKWEEIVRGKFIEITLLRRIQDGVEHYVHGFKEVIDININDGQLIMYGKKWIKKKVD